MMPQDLPPDADEIGTPPPTHLPQVTPKRVHRNGHILELLDAEWRCLHCLHWFDAVTDADAFWCGDDCTCHGRNPQ